MTKMPLGTKLTQNDSNAIFEWYFNMELKQDLCKLTGKTQRQFTGTKMSLNAGND
jgi:hypothetical protein